MEFQATVGTGLQFSSLYKCRPVNSMENGLFQTNQLKNYKSILATESEGHENTMYFLLSILQKVDS